MRLDLFLVFKKLVTSRTQAQELIKHGHVSILINNEKKIIRKSNFEVLEDFFDKVSINENSILKFVSRGGLKLEYALNFLKLSVQGFSVLDVGQSTGGFTDCLIQNGAYSVVGVDVGKDQLHSLIRNNSKVKCFESVHVNELASNELFLQSVPKGGFDMVVADVSFISLVKIIVHIKPYLKPKGIFLFLVKPQFELGPNALDKNGIVKDEKNYDIVQNSVSNETLKIFGEVSSYFQSGVSGKDGNREFFIYGKNRC